MKFKTKQQPAQIQINMAEKELCECKGTKSNGECGSIYFEKSYQIRKLSALDPQNPTNKDQYPTFPIYLCRRCGTPFKEN